MCRIFLILWVIFFSAVAMAGIGPFGTDVPAEGDLKLDEETQKKANALGHYAWSVFLWMEGRPLEESHGIYMANALKEWPESGKILRTLAAPYLQRGDHAGLVEALRPIAAENPEVLPLQVFLAMMCHAADMRPEAIATYEHVFFNLKHEKPLVVRELAALYWAEGCEDEIPAFLKKAGRSKNLRSDFVMDYAWALFHGSRAARLGKEGNEKEAEKDLERAVRYAREAAEKFGVEQGLKSCERLLEILEDGEDYETAAKLLSAAALNFPRRQIFFVARQADCLIKAGDTAAGNALLKSIDIEQQFNADLLAFIGRAAVACGDVDLALQAFETALTRAPKSDSIRFTYALVLQHLGQAEAALEAMEQMTRMHPQGYLRKSQLLGALDRWTEAEKAWNLAAVTALQEGSKDFEDAPYYLAGATIYDALGKVDECIAAARRAVKLEPENPVAANFLGYSLADAGRELEQAEQLILFAVSKEPDNDAYLDSLAWVYFRQRRFPEAAEAMARCLKRSGDFLDAVILDHAGDIFAAVGAQYLAWAYWRQALLETPANPDGIRRKLEQ